MAEIPPVSDPQIAQILERDRAKKKRTILIVVGVVLLLVVGLGGAQTYFSAQAKKKRDVAYSRVVKCVLGTPLAQGEPAMPRIRAAWRARAFAVASDKLPASLDEKEANATKLWPNRCVAEMVAFTDTLKENGDMKEGDKDLGFYSRELSKQTAGDNWKNVDTYQAALEAFLSEADKEKCAFVDVPDMQAPETLAAEPLDKLLPKTNVTPLPLGDFVRDESVQGGSRRFYLPESKGRPARLCTTKDGKSLVCATPVKGGLPIDAIGEPRIFGAEDDALPIMGFGESSALRGDGLVLVKPGEYFVAGGYSYADGRALLLLKAMDKPTGDAFKIARLAAGESKPTFSDVTLTHWDEQTTDVALLGDRVFWIDDKNQLLVRDVSKSPEGPAVPMGESPGGPSKWDGSAPMHLCRTKSGGAFYTPLTVDGGLRKTLFAFADASGAFGKLQLVDKGSVECGVDAIYVWSDFLATCRADGCQSQPLTRHASTDTSKEWLGLSVVIEGTLVTIEPDSGLIRISWDKDKTNVATKLWDGQLKGTVVLAESKVKPLHVISARGYALLVLGDGENDEHVVRLDATGAAEPVTVTAN